jgi:MSHA pilin protein MshD
MWNERARTQRGFTLVEMTVAIVILAVGVAGLTTAFSVVPQSSVAPATAKQMLAIAEEFMEEVQLKPHDAVANAVPSGCARDTFNDLADYHNHPGDGRICTVDGSPIPDLSAYTLRIQVTDTTLAGTAAKLIEVTVTHGTDSMTLVGWRTDFGD